MKIVFNRDELLRGVEIVEKSISQRPTMPILNNFLIEVTGNKARLISTDLETGIRTFVNVKSGEDCTITIPCKKFSNVIREFDSKNDITLDIQDASIKMKSGKSKISFIGVDSKDYPLLPEFDEVNNIIIKTSVLKDMIKKVSYAICTDDTRPQLTGIFFEINKDTLTLVATDGKRLSCISRPIENTTGIVASSIIPTKTITQLLQVIDIDNLETIKMSISSSQIGFKITDNIILISRVLEGKYPDYKVVIPKSFSINVDISRKELQSATRQVSLMLENDIQSCVYSFDSNNVKVHNGTNETIGENEVDVDIDYGKQKVNIAFNPTFINDVLKNLDGDKITFNMNDAIGSILINSNQDSTYINIVMPMRVM